MTWREVREVREVMKVREVSKVRNVIRWTSEHVKTRTGEQLNKRTNEHANRWTQEQVNRSTGEHVNRWRSEQVNKSTGEGKCERWRQVSQVREVREVREVITRTSEQLNIGELFTSICQIYYKRCTKWTKTSKTPTLPVRWSLYIYIYIPICPSPCSP